jgi:hypothetical protein
MMLLAFFHPDTRRLYHGKRGKTSRYGHAFGAAADYSGLAVSTRQPPVHLLFRLNTADPAVGVTLPNADWLPLLCAIRYGACNLGYRVLSDAAVKILYQAEKKAWGDFPYDGYPEKLPVQPVAITEGAYDPNKVEDALRHAGVFGYRALSSKQYAKLVRHVERKQLHELFAWESAEEYLQEGNPLPFVQGPPDDDCPDPACANHGRKSSLRTFAIFQEGIKETRKLWGPYCGSLQIIYQVCPECGAIRTSNQST